MLGEPLRLLEPPELTERVASEAPVNLGRHEGVARLEQPLADRVARRSPGHEEHLERVRIGLQRLSNGLSHRPVRCASVLAYEVFGRRHQAERPGQRQREHAASIVVRRFVGEAPRVRAHLRIEHDARQERRPRALATLRPEDLPHAARREFATRVAQGADTDDRDVELVTGNLHDAPDRCLRHATFTGHAIDARDDLRPVRKRDRTRIEVCEMANAEVHAAQSTGLQSARDWGTSGP